MKTSIMYGEYPGNFWYINKQSYWHTWWGNLGGDEMEATVLRRVIVFWTDLALGAEEVAAIEVSMPGLWADLTLTQWAEINGFAPKIQRGKIQMKIISKLKMK